MGSNSIPRNSLCCGRSLPVKSPCAFWGWPQARGVVSDDDNAWHYGQQLAPGARGWFPLSGIRGTLPGRWPQARGVVSIFEWANPPPETLAPGARGGFQVGSL